MTRRSGLVAMRKLVLYFSPMNAALRARPPPALQSGQPLSGGLRALFAFFREHQHSGSPLVLATVVATNGTTYRKRGAQMLIRNDSHWHGLLSGGCLEGDLAAHASEVFTSGSPRIVEYELAAMTDAVWGFGLGCDGSVRILLQRLDAANAWEPFASTMRAAEHGDRGRLILLCESTDESSHLGAWSLEITGHPALGQLTLPGPLPAGFSMRMAEQIELTGHGHSYLCVGVPLPHLHRLVILGGGPDALPLVQFAAQLGWHVTVVDHRTGYADAARFPAADRVVHAPEQNLPDDFDLSAADAIIIMSHNLSADERYLAQAVRSQARYIGLLGPAARKHKLLASLDETAELEGRVHGPVGLDLGGEGPEAIALSIVAEIQAMLHGKGALKRDR